MVTLMLDGPEPPGAGPVAALELRLHESYGEDPAVAHAIVSATLEAGDDAWARFVDEAGELVFVPRAWIRGWRTTRSAD